MKWKKNETQNSEARIEKLADEVRSAAYESATALWSAFLEVGELDMVHATEKALRLLVSHGDHTGAMKLLEGIYALVEVWRTYWHFSWTRGSRPPKWAAGPLYIAVCLAAGG